MLDLDWRQANGKLSSMQCELPTSAAPIGVFDSGVGGLSIVRHIQQRLPHEQLLYFADGGYAPYGEKQEAEIVARSFAIAQFLLAQGAKALVVACNTATVAAIKMLREHYSELALVGVEPGLKPAAALSKNGRVGVLATERTLSSEKFSLLQSDVSGKHEVEFFLRAGTGLVDLIEKGELTSERTRQLLDMWLTELLQYGADTIVLGCTHYPFVQPLIEELLHEKQATHMHIIDTGDAVAKQLQRVLHDRSLLCTNTQAQPSARYFTSGDSAQMQAALQNLLQHQSEVEYVHVPDVKMVGELAE